MTYCEKNKYAGINYGEEIYYVLSGLFTSASNPIFSEIEAYQLDDIKGIVLKELHFIELDEIAEYGIKTKFLPPQTIIEWFTEVLNDRSFSLKDNIRHFLTFTGKKEEQFNSNTYSREEIDILLKIDIIFNALKLFRMGLVEYLLNNENQDEMIDRVLIVFYSAWDFLLSRTKLLNEKVALNNSCYTINEYLLKYQFESYLVILMIQGKIDEKKNKSHINDWTIKQLFSKLDSLIGSNDHVSMYSKRYYIEELFDLFFKPDKYFTASSTVEEVRELLLLYFKGSLEHSPYGDQNLIVEAYSESFRRYDFVPFQDDFELVSRFYSALLPFTQDNEYNITGTIQ